MMRPAPVALLSVVMLPAPDQCPSTSRHPAMMFARRVLTSAF